MSDISEKFAQNVPGRFYVACVCIGCSLCAEIAPANFKENTDLELAVGNCYVYRQPETPEEDLHCLEAMDACPASAIRDDGDAERAAIQAHGDHHFMKKDKERSCK